MITINAARFSACSTLPCDLSRSICQFQDNNKTYHICTCISHDDDDAPPFYGGPSQTGASCYRYSVVVSVEDRLRLDVDPTLNTTWSHSYDDCCTKCAEIDCILLSFGANGSCQLLHHVPERLIPVQANEAHGTGFVVSVREVCSW